MPYLVTSVVPRSISNNHIQRNQAHDTVPIPPRAFGAYINPSVKSKELNDNDHRSDCQ